MRNRKIDRKNTMQIVIDKGLHTLLKKRAADAEMSIKEYLEGHLADLLAVEEKK